MIIEWSQDAIQDLRNLRRYIARDNVTAANQVVKKILKNVHHLCEYPSLGRQGRVLDTRELVISNTPYIVPYRVKHNIIQILRIYHSAMKWPEEFI